MADHQFNSDIQNFITNSPFSLLNFDSSVDLMNQFPDMMTIPCSSDMSSFNIQSSMEFSNDNVFTQVNDQFPGSLQEIFQGNIQQESKNEEINDSKKRKISDTPESSSASATGNKRRNVS